MSLVAPSILAHSSPSVPTRSVGALVVGGDHPGLGIARSLGRRGIPVVVIDDQHSVSEFSKYVTRTVRVSDLRDERRTVDTLLDVGRRYNLENWVVFPTRDETVAACSRYRAELAQFYRITTPEWGTVEWAWNKRKTYELATELGIPCPRTFTVTDSSELATLYDRLPLAIKPAVKENFFYATGAKAWRAGTPEDLQRLFSKARRQIPADEVLIQEIIPGGGTQQFSYCAFVRDGQPHGSMIARRERQHPFEFGRAATYVETMEEPEIEELSMRFLRAIDYYGLVEVEFKLDPRDGKYKLLDVNARTWGFHGLGMAAGVDFPYLQFADQTGQSTEPRRAAPGIGWVRMVTDIPVALTQVFSGRVKLKSYIRSLRRTRAESVFSARDFLPSLAELVMLPYLLVKKYF